jgi:hypothetical protein
MTPEERFEHIEMLLGLAVEQTEKNVRAIGEHDRVIGDIANAARDLIIVGRTCLDSIKELRETQQKAFEEMRARSDATEEKLNILVDTVDRIIRRNGKDH